jgi:hypothetical protein
MRNYPNAECGVRNAEWEARITRIDADGNEVGDSRGRSLSLSVESCHPWLHFAESGLRIAEGRKAELGMQELKG